MSDKWWTYPCRVGFGSHCPLVIAQLRFWGEDSDEQYPHSTWSGYTSHYAPVSISLLWPRENDCVLLIQVGVWDHVWKHEEWFRPTWKLNTPEDLRRHLPSWVYVMETA